jgi:hypothetical protein
MLVLVAVLVVLPAFVPVDADVARSVLHGVQASAILGAIGAFVASMMAQNRDGPTRFVLRDGGFAAPANRTYPLSTGMQLAFLALFGGHAVDEWAHREFFGAAGSVSVVMLVLGTLLFLLVLPLVVVGLWDRPALLLTPDALVVRDPFGGRTYPWEALAPWSDVRTGELRTMVLPMVRPDLVAKRGPGWWGSTVPLRFADVHPWFFADAARLYLLLPERRAGIGTAEEYDRLLVDLGVRVGV